MTRTTARSAKRRPRNRAWVPDQHGAWVMVIVPLVVGVLRAGFSWPHIPLAIAWLSGYFAFFAAGLFLKVRHSRRGRRRAQYATPLLVYGAVSAIASLVVVWARPSVLWFALLFAPLVLVAVVEAWNKRNRSLLSGISTVAASSLLIPVSASVASALDRTAWLEALLIGAYFVGTVPLVKTLIRNRGEHAMLIISVAYHGCIALLIAVLAASGVVTAWAVPLFVGLTVRAWAMPWLSNRRMSAGTQPITARTVGLTEMVWTLGVIAVVFTM